MTDITKNAEGRIDAAPSADWSRKDRTPGRRRATSLLTVAPSEKGWKVHTASGKPIGIVRTKREAVSMARQHAQETGVDIIVQRIDGTVQETIHPRG